MVVTAVRESPRWLVEGRYRLDDRIAAGGMGEVWAATDLVLGRPVAVKLLRPGLAGDEETLARFRAEARHAGSLSHPGIAQVYDYRDADPPYLVMELVEGPSLARLLDDGPLDPAATMGLLAQAAQALQAAHAAGLVHRDIKPGNVLITSAPSRPVTASGTGRFQNARGQTTGQLYGTDNPATGMRRIPEPGRAQLPTRLPKRCLAYAKDAKTTRQTPAAIKAKLDVPGRDRKTSAITGWTTSTALTTTREMPTRCRRVLTLRPSPQAGALLRTGRSGRPVRSRRAGLAR